MFRRARHFLKAHLPAHNDRIADITVGPSRRHTDIILRIWANDGVREHRCHRNREAGRKRVAGAVRLKLVAIVWLVMAYKEAT
jgi:hypothetical protein